MFKELITGVTVMFTNSVGIGTTWWYRCFCCSRQFVTTVSDGLLLLLTTGIWEPHETNRVILSDIEPDITPTVSVAYDSSSTGDISIDVSGLELLKMSVLEQPMLVSVIGDESNLTLKLLEMLLEELLTVDSTVATDYPAGAYFKYGGGISERLIKNILSLM